MCGYPRIEEPGFANAGCGRKGRPHRHSGPPTSAGGFGVPSKALAAGEKWSEGLGAVFSPSPGSAPVARGIAKRAKASQAEPSTEPRKLLWLQAQARLAKLAEPRHTPFHGGNAGSNPAGDTNLFSGLRSLLPAVPGLR